MSKYIKTFKPSYQDSKWAGGELVGDMMHQISEDKQNSIKCNKYFHIF